MKKILIDTNAYSSFMAGNKIILDYIIDSEITYFSTIVIGELYVNLEPSVKLKIWLDLVQYNKLFVKQNCLISRANITNGFVSNNAKLLLIYS